MLVRLFRARVRRRRTSAVISASRAALYSALSLLAMAPYAARVAAADERAAVYVSAAKANQLVHYELDLGSGALVERTKIALPGAPGPQCRHALDDRLYVAVRAARSVAAFRRDRASGDLELLRLTSIESNAAYIATDRTGRWLLAASYGEGKVSTHAIEPDGAIGAAVSVIDTERCAHAILPDRTNRFALVPHTCPNAVYQFRFDADTGTLSANDPAIVRPADGLEPRHLAFHPALDVVYFDDERGSSVTAYRYDPERGHVEPVQTVSTLPDGFAERNTCADIEITSDGRFVYASNRGHNSIAAFATDPESGELRAVGQFSTGDTPRSFNLSPDEGWVVAAGQRSNDLTVYRRDAASGALARVDVHPTSAGPAWVEIAPIGFGTPAATETTADADGNWPRFRGANGTGVARDDPRLPERWSTTENVAWKADVPGWGWASPVVWGDQVFVASVESDGEYAKPKKGLYLGRGRKELPDGLHRWVVRSYHAETGDLRWSREAHRDHPRSPRHPKSTFASETPATDGERLYVLFGDVGLYAYDLDGNAVWSQRIEPKSTFYDYGAAASPVVHDGQVFMVYDNQEASYVAAYDAETGAERWRTPREEKSTWATPLVWKNDLRTELVVPGKRKNRSYDLGGAVLWEFDGAMSNLVIPSPLSSEGMVYITSGYVGDRHRPVYAVRPGATGDVSGAEPGPAKGVTKWYQPKAGPYNTSPIVYRGRYHTVLDRGFMTCHDAATGEEIYGKRRFPSGSTFTSSPWAYNGRIFCLTEDGDTHVVSAGPGFELLHTNRLDELCMATPAVSRGRLFIRTASKLYCLSLAR